MTSQVNLTNIITYQDDHCTDLEGHDHCFGHYLMQRLSRRVSPVAVAAVSVLA
jgi:hypothetical protein